MRTSPDRITHLKPGDVFVFGSNLAGIHGAGAAALARRSFGAEVGVGEGPTGSCYALPTKDRAIETLPLQAIGEAVARFIDYAKSDTGSRYLVTQIGCGLAGYTPEQIAPLFFRDPVPENVYLPAEFWQHRP